MLPWYVTNTIIHQDNTIPEVNMDQTGIFSGSNNSLIEHPNLLLRPMSLLLLEIEILAMSDTHDEHVWERHIYELLRTSLTCKLKKILLISQAIANPP